jgi:thioredoxin 1
MEKIVLILILGILMGCNNSLNTKSPTESQAIEKNRSHPEQDLKLQDEVSILSDEEKNIIKLVNESELPVVLFFKANWSGPSKTASPIIWNIANEYKDKIKVIEVDIDSVRDGNKSTILSKYDIDAVPSFVFLKSGKMIKKVTGVISKNKLIEIIVADLRVEP